MVKKMFSDKYIKTSNYDLKIDISIEYGLILTIYRR